jgi:RND family efflux transporter MFP subunit
VLLLAGIAAAGAIAWRRAGPVTVEVVRPTRGPAVDAIYATGTVEPTVMLPIAPRIAGRLATLNVDEGANVKAGQVLARLDATDLESTVDELAARARFAADQLRRTEELVKRGVAAAIDLDRARSEADAANASLRRARAQRDFAALIAPANGTIIRRDGEIGQYIPAGQPVFYLSCCAPLRVTAEVDEEDIPRVRIGQPVVLRADALPGRTYDGSVAEITPKGDPVARSYRVRIRVPEPDGLQVGMTMDANLVVSERQNALLVPTSAIRDAAVWTVVDGRLRRQPLRVGVSGPARTEVLSGLADDAIVVVAPDAKFTDGRRVRVKQSAAASASNTAGAGASNAAATATSGAPAVTGAAASTGTADAARAR